MFSSLSLRNKVLFLMTALTALTLALYLFVAVRIFRGDKLAEVSYNSAAVARGLATQARIELDSIINSIKPIVQGFDFQTNQLSTNSANLLPSINEIEHLTLYRRNGNNQFIKVADLPSGQPDPVLEALPIHFDQVESEGTQLDILPGGTKPRVVLSARFGAADNPMHLIAVASLRGMRFVDAVQAPSNYANVVLGENAKVLIANDSLDPEKLPPFSEWQFILDLLKSSPPPGSAEITPEGSKEPVLLAYAHIGIGKTVVLSYINKSEAMNAVKLLMTKSVLMFIGLLCFTIIVSILASQQITSALRKLTAASHEVAAGKFDVQIDVRGRDEIGSLAQSFNSMAQQLSWYVIQVKEKAALESELNTARTVQETLFPPENSDIEQLEISGRYEPASQCGGDWWYYSRVGDKIFMWIGDATGHGVSAALLTSAARSAASIIEMFPSVGPGQALQMMNRAIHETSKGKLLMTFFIGAYDLKTGELVYANASHEPPWLFQSSDGPASKKGIIPLNAANNPRLGEAPQTGYEEARIQLSPGDRIFFYTDGVSELQNEKGETWGERKFIKSVVTALNENEETSHVAQKIQKEINDYRSGAKLEDDVTFFLCKVRDVA